MKINPMVKHGLFCILFYLMGVFWILTMCNAGSPILAVVVSFPMLFISGINLAGVVLESHKSIESDKH